MKLPAEIREDIVRELNSWDRRYATSETVADNILEIVADALKEAPYVVREWATGRPMQERK